ncbi:cytochrome P450 2B9-like [Arvicanthis niloticus]|uniref:cytochrome P450 2B9-like n=1 Tax=Arvicanthis niloticus TaxID=61156 RepID=UPI00402BD136
MISKALVDHSVAFSGQETIAVVQPIMQDYGAPLDPTFLLQCITANIICSIVFGERFDYTDNQFLCLAGVSDGVFICLNQLLGGTSQKTTCFCL